MTDEFELSRRKILGAVGGVGIASAGAGMGTSAFFNDTESFEGNSMTAGELDLKVDWEEHYSDWKGEEIQYASMEDGSLVIDDLDGFMNSTLIESFPDDDNDGQQEFSGEPACSDDSYLADSDLPDVLSSEYRTNTDELGEPLHGQTTSPGDPLVNLQDVKPGDSGEITFSLHLCDNPGYIWLTGELTENAENGVREPEAKDPDEDDGDGEADSKAGDSMSGELADEIMVNAWYDPDCDNVLDEGESIIFQTGTLNDVLDNLASGGVRLDASKHGGGDSSSGSEGEDECRELGKLEWTDSEFRPEADDTNAEVVHDADGAVGDQIKLVADDGTGNYATIEIEDIEFKDGDPSEPIRVEWQIVDSTDIDDDNDGDIGICALDVTAANDTQRLFEGPLCITGSENTSTDTFATEGDTQPAISNIQFDYCITDGGGGTPDDGVCFQPGQKYCIGLEWMLPSSVGNEVQGDSVAFDLGFYTEQCRHNDDPSGPTSS